MRRHPAAHSAGSVSRSVFPQGKAASNCTSICSSSPTRVCRAWNRVSSCERKTASSAKVESAVSLTGPGPAG
eukprot:1460072-Pyramimonas_sp.AAC.1